MTKMAKTVTNILKLSPTHFVSNIHHQHRYNPFISFGATYIIWIECRIGAADLFFEAQSLIGLGVLRHLISPNLKVH